ncbi:hypothetical protein F8M49_21510 [Rhodococcus zopfii]|uniref:Uncharacterized protein n=1 Tax=Rhodococcus zopfii TaxID=43772 RepID=A0ABU3WTH0_9NOCA|nr:hypothetical protein [Rhodococcus zopfii]
MSDNTTEAGDPIATAPAIEAKILEQIVCTRSLDSDVLAKVRGHAADPASWELTDDGVLTYRRGSVVVQVAAVDRWDGDFLRYSRITDTGPAVVLDQPADFDDGDTIAADVLDGLALLDA